jgi:ribose-phosphate pyrophosphokinase
MDPLLFAMNSGSDFGRPVAAALGTELAPHEERDFAYGEHKARPLTNVRDRDVYVLQALHGDRAMSANDKLVRLLFFVGALRDAGAARVTAVVPYLCYARKDAKTKPRDPVTTRYVAALFEAVGTDRVVTLDVHNLAAFQNAFRIRTEHVEAKQVLVEHIAAWARNRDVTVLSPDAGGMKRAEAFRQALERRIDGPVSGAVMEKHRSSGVVSGELLAGDVRGRSVLIVDDLISSGGTLVRAARACLDHGAVDVQAVATHCALTESAVDAFRDPVLARIVVTDSITPLPPEAAAAGDRLRVVETAPLFAEVIRRMHRGGSIVDLLG